MAEPSRAPTPQTAAAATQTANKRWWGLPTAVTVVVAVILLVVLLVVFSTVGLAQAFTWSGTVSSPGSSSTGYTPSHSGTFDFAWSNASGVPVTFTVLSPSGSTLFSNAVPVANGTGSVSVSGGSTYKLEISSALAATTSISGTLYFTAAPISI